jgi:hypothetical protein
MCGPAAPSPQQQQTQITELPEWARPSAQRVLAKGEALTAQPYQTYDANRIAGFSPLQQQAFQGAQQLGPTQQTAMGSNLAAASGLGALGTGYRAGRFSGGQFTPMAAGQYMSPFIEQAMAPQLREAQRSSDIMGQQNAAKAAQMGAFGGSRQGLMEAERQRNLGMQLGDIRGRGYQTAYEQAAGQFNQDMARRMQAQQLGEQSRQFGANLGLQGLQTGLQAAGQLGALGQQQFAQQQGAIQAQSAAGAQQQALEQQGLTQAYQDFLNQQNYPYKQLGFMSDLIRGLPLGQQSTSSIYQAPPSALQSIGTLGLGAYGINQLFGGGKKDGGLVGYADGGSVEAPENVANIVSKLSDQQLEVAKQAAQARGDAQQLQAIIVEQSMRASERGGMASIYNRLPPEQQAAMAGGGIVAFADNRDQPIREDMPGTGEVSISPYGNLDFQSYGDIQQQINSAQAKLRQARASNDRSGIIQASDELFELNKIQKNIPQSKEVKKPPVFLDSDSAEAADRMTGRLSNIVSSPAAAGTPSARPAAAPVAAAAPRANTSLNELLTTGRQIASMEPTPAPDEEAFIRKSMETRSKILGENLAIKEAQEMISERKAGREEALTKGMGISALIAAGAMSQGNDFMRALGNTSRAFAESYKDVLAADQAERKAIQEAQIKLADSQYKQRVGDYDGAKADYREYLNMLQKADRFKFDKLKATSDVQYHAGTLENQKRQIDATREARKPSVFETAMAAVEIDPKYKNASPAEKVAAAQRIANPIGEERLSISRQANADRAWDKFINGSEGLSLKIALMSQDPRVKANAMAELEAKKREIYGGASVETTGSSQGFEMVGKRPG